MHTHVIIYRIEYHKEFMDYTFILDKCSALGLPINPDKLLEYVEYLKRKPNVRVKRALDHRHHILPKVFFPQYTKEPKNVISLIAPQHAYAHFLLAQAIHAGSMYIAAIRLAEMFCPNAVHRIKRDLYLIYPSCEATICPLTRQGQISQNRAAVKPENSDT